MRHKKRWNSYQFLDVMWHHSLPNLKAKQFYTNVNVDQTYLPSFFQAQLSQMEDYLPRPSGRYLKTILGSVNMSILDKEAKYQYKEQYEQFKLIVMLIGKTESNSNHSFDLTNTGFFWTRFRQTAFLTLPKPWVFSWIFWKAARFSFTIDYFWSISVL